MSRKTALVVAVFLAVVVPVPGVFAVALVFLWRRPRRSGSLKPGT